MIFSTRMQDSNVFNFIGMGEHIKELHSQEFLNFLEDGINVKIQPLCNSNNSHCLRCCQVPTRLPRVTKRQRLMFNLGCRGYPLSISIISTFLRVILILMLLPIVSGIPIDAGNHSMQGGQHVAATTAVATGLVTIDKISDSLEKRRQKMGPPEQTQRKR